MQYRPLSGTGLQVSALSLGTATFGVAPDPQEALRLVDVALDRGINVIDTANSYGNQSRFDRVGAPPASERESAEELVGRALRGRRDDVVLCTKVSEAIGNGPNDGGPNGGGLSRKHVMRMVERSLTRLQTDHIDVYYAHHPDPRTPIEEWLSTFGDLITQGKIRSYAISTFAGWQIAETVLTADRLGVPRPACHQTRYSAAQRAIEAEALPASLHFGMGTAVFSPLAGGLLAGSATSRTYTGNARWGGPGFTDAELAFAEQFTALADAWGCTPAHLALAWVLAQPGIVSAIVGPESATELDELVGVADLTLTAEQCAAVAQLAAAPTSS